VLVALLRDRSCRHGSHRVGPPRHAAHHGRFASARADRPSADEPRVRGFRRKAAAVRPPRGRHGAGCRRSHEDRSPPVQDLTMSQRCIWSLFALLAIGCSPSTVAPPEPDAAQTPAPIAATIGPEGGTVSDPSGAALVIPVGALATPTQITLTPIPAVSAAALG